MRVFLGLRVLSRLMVFSGLRVLSGLRVFSGLREFSGLRVLSGLGVLSGLSVFSGLRVFSCFEDSRQHQTTLCRLCVLCSEVLMLGGEPFTYNLRSLTLLCSVSEGNCARWIC